jgi:hypothetical protein
MRAIDPIWLSRRAAGQMLGLHPRTAGKVLDQLQVRQLRLPGLPVRYQRHDLELVLGQVVTTPSTAA